MIRIRKFFVPIAASVVGFGVAFPLVAESAIAYNHHHHHASAIVLRAGGAASISCAERLSPKRCNRRRA